MLSQNQVNNICLPYNGYKCCRYLVEDDNTGDFLCCKKIQNLKDDIDERVDKHIASAARNNYSLEVLGKPVGDNCSGYLYLKSVLQGYDIPGSV